MSPIRSFSLALALAVVPALSQAAPMEYTFDLTLTELAFTRSDRPIDPAHSQFSLGQTFHGSLIYDHEAAALQGPAGRYFQAAQFSIQIGDATFVGKPFEELFTGPYVEIEDSAPGAGADTLLIFDEIPRQEGPFGSAPNRGYAEQMYLSFTDSTGTAFDSTVPGALDFSAFDGSRWNFWWQYESVYSTMYMYGTIGNVTAAQVPTPGPLALSFAAMAGLVAFRFRSRALKSST